MFLSRNKINIQMAKNGLNVTKLAALYGVSRSRMNVIINSRNLTPVTMGRLAKALNVDVTEIIED